MEQYVSSNAEKTRRESSRDFSAAVAVVSFAVLFMAFGCLALYKVLSRLAQ